MSLPFSPEQFHAVFRAYNVAVWPAQGLLTALAVAAVALAAWSRRRPGPLIAAVLGLLWAWTGLAYHHAFFSAINPLAPLFAVLSLTAAVLFGWHGVVRRRLEFRLRRDVRSALAALLIAYALVVYPLWLLLAGQRYPDFVTFGLPCPTTIFTIGLLCAAATPLPRSVLVVPVAWCFVGGQAAWLLGVPQDLGLFAAGAVGLWLLARPAR